MLITAASFTDVSTEAAEADRMQWIMLLPAGTVAPRDGRGPWSIDIEKVLTATRAFFGPTDPAIDYEHQAVFTKDNGQRAVAAGWIKDLEARPDGLWGKVEWTKAAADHIAAKEYRYISPTFSVEESTNQVTLLAGAALVIAPALDLPAIASSQIPDTSENPDMALAATLAGILGLSSTSNDDAITAAVRSLAGERTQLCTALKVDVATQGVQLITAAADIAQRAESPDPARYAPVAAVDALRTELATVKADAAKTKAETLVTAAMASGAVIPALKDWAIDLATRDPEKFEEWVSKSPKVAGEQTVTTSAKSPENQTGSLNPEQLKACRLLGLTPEKFLASQEKA